MSKMTHLMLDLETFGKSSNAVISQIGACYFDPSGRVGRTFFHNVDARSCQEVGLTLDADTIYWWLSQSKEAQESLLRERIPLNRILTKFTRFSRFADVIWSHATFDFVILRNAYLAAGISFPFSYRAARDIRTIAHGASKVIKNTERTGIHHNALDDALFQVKYVAPLMVRTGIGLGART